MFVQYSFVERRNINSRQGRGSFHMTDSMISLAGLGCMLLTAAAYIMI